MTYHGGCKCGAVAYEAQGDIKQLMECNCSICKPKGYLHWFVADADFKLTTPPEALGEFTFKAHKLNHRFCLTCGCSPFVQGPGTVAVNARTLHDFDVSSVPIKAYDGAAL